MFSTEEALLQATRCKRTHKEAMQRGDTSLFTQRPLTESALQYCTVDVAHLFSMHALWCGLFADPQLIERVSTARMQAFCDNALPPQHTRSAVDFALLPVTVAH